MRDQYRIGDALDFLRDMRNEDVAGIVTSPPYNKGFKGRGGKGSNWGNSKLMAESYENYSDDLPEDEYVRWQRSVLEIGLEVVGEEGVIVYNMGRRIRDLQEDRRESIVRGLPVRQTIIWDRNMGNNFGGRRPTILTPRYELIYLIAGRRWRVPERYLTEARKWGDVWRVRPEMRNPHPAPFPLELATRMVSLVDGMVLDPFAGSGTVGIAAMTLGMSFMLNDLSPAYRRMYWNRVWEMEHA